DAWADNYFTPGTLKSNRRLMFFEQPTTTWSANAAGGVVTPGTPPQNRSVKRKTVKKKTVRKKTVKTKTGKKKTTKKNTVKKRTVTKKKPKRAAAKAGRKTPARTLKKKRDGRARE